MSLAMAMIFAAKTARRVAGGRGRKSTGVAYLCAPALDVTPELQAAVLAEGRDGLSLRSGRRSGYHEHSSRSGARMDQAEMEERLSRIATLWTVVYRAHKEGADAVVAARNRLMLRYHGAAYRYLLGAVRDPDAAGDLCQEFAVRFLRGDFRRAAPDRGRFRDYIKIALVNLVNDHHRARQAAPKALAPDAAEPNASAGEAEDFEAGWRAELLEQTWKALAAENPTFHATLRLRAVDPDLPSGDMAERLGRQLGRPMTAENVRKTIQRAHSKFADLMLELVAESLDEPTHESLEEELKALDLLRYCRSALMRWSAKD